MTPPKADEGRAALDAALSPKLALTPGEIAGRTDAYFNRTQKIVSHFGECQVTYALFIRRPVIAAHGLMVAWLENVAREQGFSVEIETIYPEGSWVGAGEPLLYLTGPFTRMAPLETLLLQKLGSACVAAHNAYQMALALPDAAFMAMEARHCAGFEMQEMMGYAASIGSRAARREGAKGFVGCANDVTAAFFGQDHGLGTMPHALIGYAGSTLRAAEMYREVYPDDPLVVLVDYFGQEITDALAVCRRFPELAAQGRISVRLDTHGGRFIEGLDPQSSYAVLERHTPGTIRRYRSDNELKDLVGTGVSAAAIWWMREQLNAAGFPEVRIIVSSGFGLQKCMTMRDSHAPLDVVGTGSFIPVKWNETYATADIVAYDGEKRVKVGREFLLQRIRSREKESEA
ncbi:MULTISPECIES: beta/alpha barrel domain-containing protein [Asaia]|uniref:Nicotinate phosphoribosyltransferase n=2 Tax=Asaia bogorensis TaxID=91915 RepID=A0AAN4R690_9PROT|nr:MULTISPECIES: nicotinate phosphoribosyltransferase [Asaia]ETC99134.1 nicotinate phosphoribosyltransferase [Asaia sp. SF2.1]CDG39942.1 Nicotinate phosphoribosyltransferase [Asaia bogorensis]BAT19170.1 nicotinic acid phosphoribosyltransferase [Asaia bogorensis NBRC 16594]GBQ72966.1 nicotinic acid phosphoribosyltransferase [Asaia bogorensis NBRC 16594]GEL53524.1 nicotinate phosphoribosyltransferase [Asaia bogorensis NBRC 16594]